MNSSLGINGDIPLYSSLSCISGALCGGGRFPCSDQNLSGALMSEH
jgi:hypothetical protein